MANQTAEDNAKLPRQFVHFGFYKADQSWLQRGDAERKSGVEELSSVVHDWSRRILVYPYTTFGIRSETDFLLWRISYDLDDFDKMSTDIRKTNFGKHLKLSQSFLAMTKTSIYVDDHIHDDQEASRNRIVVGGGKYLFVYPFVKTREWYLLPVEERQRAMKQHIVFGHRYPSVKLNTTYSFGLDDQDFVVAFESNYPEDFLDLVQGLRETEASRYTQRDTPIFTCTKQDIGTILGHISGI